MSSKYSSLALVLWWPAELRVATIRCDRIWPISRGLIRWRLRSFLPMGVQSGLFSKYRGAWFG